jgi:hypothetical protein
VTLTAVHNPGTRHDDALVTIPVPRTAAADWPGDNDVAFVPASLLLAARGKCSCPNCVDGFVHMMRRTRLRTV